ncbi:hypothetical protein CHS0354_004517 [Potamilus streckersoni]|uniref:Uncharacterized protein n=1 Tax=Potamilus streckersoni TaxID=2493646 RepID=A0AAE0S5D3_9BIVA|nr:hypothetical protein CHS0354_004517 [Potamilus streckersoni]
MDRQIDEKGLYKQMGYTMNKGCTVDRQMDKGYTLDRPGQGSHCMYRWATVSLWTKITQSSTVLTEDGKWFHCGQIAKGYNVWTDRGIVKLYGQVDGQGLHCKDRQEQGLHCMDRQEQGLHCMDRQKNKGYTEWTDRWTRVTLYEQIDKSYIVWTKRGT